MQYAEVGCFHPLFPQQTRSSRKKMMYSKFVNIMLILCTWSRPEIRTAPLGQTIFFGSLAAFNCATSEGAPTWLINRTQYIAIEGPHTANGIVRTVLRQTGRDEYFSELQINSSVISNNNTEIKCRVDSMESNPVFLRVQGVLSAPANLSAVSVNISTVLVSWLPPFTLNITDGPSILGYNVRIKDFVDDVFLHATEYYYYIPSCHFGLVVSVAALNDLGVGAYGELNISHTVNAILSPNTNNLLQCEAICDESLLLAWVINGTFLSHRGNDILETRSSNFHQCGENGSSTYTEFLKVAVTEQFTSLSVQCVGLCVCWEDSIVPNCTSRNFYSHAIHVEASTLDIEAENNHEQNDMTSATKAVTTEETSERTVQLGDNTLVISIGAVACVPTLLCLLILSGLVCYKCCFLKKQVQEAIATSTNEVIYEQCGDPVSTLPSPPHSKMQPCPAYVATSHPRMEPCTAYAVSSHSGLQTN